MTAIKMFLVSSPKVVLKVLQVIAVMLLAL